MQLKAQDWILDSHKHEESRITFWVENVNLVYIWQVLLMPDGKTWLVWVTIIWGMWLTYGSQVLFSHSKLLFNPLLRFFQGLFLHEQIISLYMYMYTKTFMYVHVSPSSFFPSFGQNSTTPLTWYFNLLSTALKAFQGIYAKSTKFSYKQLNQQSVETNQPHSKWIFAVATRVFKWAGTRCKSPAPSSICTGHFLYSNVY